MTPRWLGHASQSPLSFFLSSFHKGKCSTWLLICCRKFSKLFDLQWGLISMRMREPSVIGSFFWWIWQSLGHSFNRLSIWFPTLKSRHFIFEVHLNILMLSTSCPCLIEVIIIGVGGWFNWWRLLMCWYPA